VSRHRRPLRRRTSEGLDIGCLLRELRGHHLRRKQKQPQAGFSEHAFTGRQREAETDRRAACVHSTIKRGDDDRPGQVDHCQSGFELAFERAVAVQSQVQFNHNAAENNMIPTFITPRRAWIAAGILCVLFVSLWGAGKYHAAKLTSLKADNARIVDQYQQQLGVAHASELAAREEAMKAQALVAAVEQGNRNVAALGAKIEQAGSNYEKSKSNLGDCVDAADCLQRLCAELKSAGFKTQCD